jgi:hypothetical protein
VLVSPALALVPPALALVTPALALVTPALALVALPLVTPALALGVPERERGAVGRVPPSELAGAQPATPEASTAATTLITSGGRRGTSLMRSFMRRS